MTKHKRDYRKEYDTYQGTPEQLKNQALRHAARNKLVKEGLVKKGDGKEVDHKDGNPPQQQALEPAGAVAFGQPQEGWLTSHQLCVSSSSELCSSRAFPPWRPGWDGLSLKRF